jgi:prepilin-type N-terminal cleavage/methylation domain-containing protein
MRRGISLIELMAVLTIGSVLMGIAVSLLLVLLRVEQTSRAHVEQSTAVYTLADQFRRDVRAAGRAAADPAEKNHAIALFLTAGHEVHYSDRGGEVERIETGDGKTIRRESYALPAEWSATVDVVSWARPALAWMTLAPKDAALRTVRELRIEAAIGEDHRFERRKGEK